MKPYLNVNTDDQLTDFARHCTRERLSDIQDFDNLSGRVFKNYQSFKTILATADIGDASYTYIDATAGNITASLPDPALVPGQIFCMKRTDASGNTVTINARNGGTIDNSASKSMASLAAIMVQSDGVEYWII